APPVAVGGGGRRLLPPRPGDRARLRADGAADRGRPLHLSRLRAVGGPGGRRPRPARSPPRDAGARGRVPRRPRRAHLPADARMAWGDDAGAIADYTAAVRIKPTYIEAYNNRGLARQRTGDLAGAIADYQEALRLSPLDWRPRAMIQGNLALAEQALARRTRE